MRARFLNRLLFLIALVLVFSSEVYAGENYALLIGNETYIDSVGALHFPRSDVDLLENTLTKLGFKVTKLINLGYPDFQKAVAQHSMKVRDAGADSIGFIYYSGHGAASPYGKNYLIPVDVKGADDNSLWVNSLDVQSDVIGKLKSNAPAAIHFVVLDACRNELRLNRPKKAINVNDKAYVRLPQESGVVIAYATEEGKTASDNGQYAKILAKHLLTPNLEAISMFRAVELEVREKENQSPFLQWSSAREVYFAGRTTTDAPQSGRPQAAQYKTCRLPEFGQEGWIRSEVYSGQTGWVDGGFDQNWGCKEVAGDFIRNRAISERNSVEKISSSERSQKDWLGHVTYSYSCTVKVSWDPLYNEKTDPKCGTVVP
jgi:Caspase domain